MQMSNMEKFVVTGMNNIYRIIEEMDDYGRWIQKYKKRRHRRYVNQILNNASTDFDNLSLLVTKRCTDWDII